MNRRTFIGAVATGLTLAQSPDLLRGAPQTGLAAPNPAWLGNRPLVIVGNWDSIPLFQTREGGEPVWLETEDRKDSSERAVSRLKDIGVSMAIIHFFKGFGLVAEKDHIAAAKSLAALLKKYEIRVGLYVGSTIAYETFLLEKPEAEEWFVPDYLGDPVFYDDQTFRKRVYFMHPGYVDYIKRVVRIGIEELKADDMDFDNTSWQARPAIFQHPLAVEDFRAYLRNNHSPEELTERLGFSDVKYVLPPKYGRPLTTINDPLFQLWADFRCYQLNAYYAEMRALIRELNPQAALSANPSSGMAGVNTIWVQGTSYPGLVPHLDLVWTEEGNNAAISADGILISKIRTYKMATILNSRILTYTAGSHDIAGSLALAESMAFNRQTLGMVGGMLAGSQLPAGQRRYVKFFHDNFDCYRGVENVPEVAVLYSYATMGFNNDRPAVSFMLFTQTLIQARIPFDIIFDEQLED
ncbi:MAG: hypothetical protein ACRD1N_10810, partial [Terriglobia bacterium]